MNKYFVYICVLLILSSCYQKSNKSRLFYEIYKEIPYNKITSVGIIRHDSILRLIDDTSQIKRIVKLVINSKTKTTKFPALLHMSFYDSNKSEIFGIGFQNNSLYIKGEFGGVYKLEEPLITDSSLYKKNYDDELK